MLEHLCSHLYTLPCCVPGTHMPPGLCIVLPLWSFIALSLKLERHLVQYTVERDRPDGCKDSGSCPALPSSSEINTFYFFTVTIQ